jgi:hypothetical protein
VRRARRIPIPKPPRANFDRYHMIPAGTDFFPDRRLSIPQSIKVQPSSYAYDILAPHAYSFSSYTNSRIRC